MSVEIEVGVEFPVALLQVPDRLQLELAGEPPSVCVTRKATS